MIINFLLPLFLNRIGGPQWIIILIIILLLFGGRKIPELMKGLGRGVRAFKEGINEAEDTLKSTDDQNRDTDVKTPENK